MLAGATRCERRPTGTLSGWLILASLLSVLRGQALAANDRDLAKVNAAIDDLRGHDSRTLTTQSAKALDEKLDKAWDVLTRYASISKKRIPEILSEERSGFEVECRALVTFGLRQPCMGSS